jgi:hypothetical protein
VSRLVLVPSPLLGPAAWGPCADWLRGQGLEVVVPEPDRDDWRPAAVLAAVVRATEGLGELVLVPHSQAGLYAPRLGELLPVRATVYVDAALPTGGRETTLARPGFLERLRSLADPDGVLPVWTRWWDDVDDLFPDAATRAAVEREQRRLPLAYFTSRVPVPDGWAERPAAYLGFGATYADELAFARAQRWPTTVLAGRHLHQLVDPAAVGSTILALLAALLPESA